MARLLGALLVAVSALAGVVGVGWLLLDAVGTEWDYCRGSGCTAGWKMGAGFTLAALAGTVLGVALLRSVGRRPSA